MPLVIRCGFRLSYVTSHLAMPLLKPVAGGCVRHQGSILARAQQNY